MGDIEGTSAASPGRRPGGPIAAVQFGLVAASLAGPMIARRLSRTMKPGTASTVTVAGIVMGGHGVVALMERFFPFREEWNEPRDNDLLVDGTYHFLQSPVTLGFSGLVTSVLPALIFGKKEEHSRRRSLLARVPLVARLGVALAVSEWSHYWWHRVGHHRGWRWHSVHHSAKRLYWLNALRFHFLDSIGDGVTQGVALSILDADPATMLAHNVFAGVYGQIQHANVRGASGWLRHVFATPEIHRWHHSTDTAEGNSNYGARLSLWDRVFGTYFFPTDRAFDAEIGVGDMPSFPTGYLGQARVPFRWSSVEETSLPSWRP